MGVLKSGDSDDVKLSKALFCPQLWADGYGVKPNATDQGAIKAYRTTYAFNADIIVQSTDPAKTFAEHKITKPTETAILADARTYPIDASGAKWVAYFYRKQDIQFIKGNGSPYYDSTYLSLSAPHGTGDNVNFRGQCNTTYADGHAAGFNWKNVKNKYYAPFAYQDIEGNVWDAHMWE